MSRLPDNVVFNISTCPYISFEYARLNMLDWSIAGSWVMERRRWLEEHVGQEYFEWKFRIGDRFAEGVYIKDEKLAILFKLAFT